jgi:oligoendopeptidase F
MPAGSSRVPVELRRRALGLARADYADMYAEMPGLDRTFAASEAMEAAVASSAGFGAEYQAGLRARMREPWMHFAPGPAKSDIYGIFPPVGGAAPYFVMTYQPSYRRARALAGGLALMKAFADIPRDAAPDTRDDPGIYSNAVIYVGDLLFDDYHAGRASGGRERAAYLLADLDLLWAHYFRWAIVSDFEARVQELVARGEAPSGAGVSRLYLGLLREYYGPGVAVDDAFAGEWMTFPVSFLSYEGQFWPPAMAAACAIVERKLAFDRALGRGEVDLSYQIFMGLGVDMASPDPYEAVIRRMNARMDELERLL